MKAVPFKNFSTTENHTWKLLFERQARSRTDQVFDIFARGVDQLHLSSDRIPDLTEVNKHLEKLSSFKGVSVEGLEDGNSFYPMLARREFPIGNFIRDPKDLSYTPAPDVFHDLYGHLPFLADKDYADFCYDLGKRACKYISDPKKLCQFERLFWFTIEFALIQTTNGPRIFGAGIASSFGECQYALSTEPEVVPFDLDVIRNQEFKIDEFQKRIFLLENTEQLYRCLNDFERNLA